MLGGLRSSPIGISFNRVILLLLGVTLAASVALCALAWRLVVLDRTVHQQRTRERLEQAADAGSSALLQHLARTGERLRAITNLEPARRESALAELAGTGGGSAAVLLEGHSLKLVPKRRLRFLPEAPDAAPIAEAVFAPGEVMEYQRRDPAAAARFFRELANRSEGPVRAGALLRAARNEVKQDHRARALADYAELIGLGPVTVVREPAELVGGYARLPLLNEAERSFEAASLVRDLEAARWPLSRESYAFYRDELARMVHLESAIPLWEESISELVSAPRQDGMESGERVIWAGGSQPVLLIWRSRADTVAGLAITGKSVAEWVAGAPGFAFGLVMADGRALIPLPAGETRSQRILSFANSHWRLVAAPTGPVLEPKGAEPLLLAGLWLVIILVVAGSYAVIRAVSRELAVARLQADFVSAVSHEFRSPLTTLRSISEMLERGRVPTPERKQRYYELLARETARLHRMVEDLLDFGRMEAGVQRYQMRPTDAATLVSQTISEFQEEHSAAGFEIELSGVRSAPVLADSEAMRRAVRNLLDNAAKYSPNSQRIEVDVRVEDGQVYIAVQDHGMGISPEDLKRIFRKFERGAAAKASNIRGTGLGLAMVHAIVRSHHGAVRVESEVNRGTIFTVSLPSAGAAEESMAWHASS